MVSKNATRQRFSIAFIPAVSLLVFCLRVSAQEPVENELDLISWSTGIDWESRGPNYNSRLSHPVNPEGITLKPIQFNYYPIPAIIHGDYDLDVEWTRKTGAEAVGIAFPVGEKTPIVDFGSHSARYAAIHAIDGAGVVNSPASKTPSVIKNGKRYHVQIRVRRNGDTASINIDFDGMVDYLTWSGPVNALSGSVSMPGHPWLYAWDSETTFHKLNLRMLNGIAYRDVITDQEKKDDLENGFVRLVGQAAYLPKVGHNVFMINQTPMGKAMTPEQFIPRVSINGTHATSYILAHAPSKIRCPIPRGSKSFSVVGVNQASRSTKFQVLVDGVQEYDSGVTGLAIIKIDLPPKAITVELVVDDAGALDFDRSFWCYPRFHRQPSDAIDDDKMTAGSGRITIEAGTVGAGKLEYNGETTAAPIDFRVAALCDEYLYAHAPSTVTYAVPEGMTRFSAIGWCTLSATVRFELWSDSQRLFQSVQAGVVPIDVRLPTGTKSITLKIIEGKSFDNDQSFWCYPRLHRK
ncbi:hypothetical protein GC163_00940 [bacterium]|nr:hypothetical protein [bacterium]